MANIMRHHSRRHRLVKHLIATARFSEAEAELKSERVWLVRMLKQPGTDHDRIELRLTRNSSLLAECYSKWGKPLKAEKYFSKALKHCERLEDPIVRERILRVKAVHLDTTLGRHFVAEQTLEAVITRLEELKHEVLTPERMATEIAYTRGMLAKCRLMQDRFNEDAAFGLLRACDQLRRCGHPRYEQDVVMSYLTLVPRINPWLKRRLLQQAFMLNIMNDRYTDDFLQMSDSLTIVPIATFTRGAIARLGF